MDGERLQEVGKRIRHLRATHSMSLRALAKESGLSVGFLSQIERGLSSFSVPSLRAICRALNVSLAEILVMTNGPGKAFLADPRPATITKADTRAIVNLQNTSVKYRFLSTGYPQRQFEAFVGEMEAGSSNEGAAHAGEEFGFVLWGTVLLCANDEQQELSAHDSYHMVSPGHHVCEAGGDGARVLWVRTTSATTVDPSPFSSRKRPHDPLSTPPGSIVADGGGSPPVSLNSNAIRYRFLSSGIPNARLRVAVAEIPPRYQPGPRSFEGEEFGYVLQGHLELLTGEDSYSLGPCDSYHLPPLSGQDFRTNDNEGALVLWIQMVSAESTLEEALDGATRSAKASPDM